MRRLITTLAAVGISAPAIANDWQKFYHPVADARSAIPWNGAPETLMGSGNLMADVDGMWRRGFAVIGYSAFNSPNNKTADAIRWGKDLKARYVMMGTSLVSSRTTALPLTLPSSTTSTTNGRVGGTPFSATTTHYGTQTSFIPVTVNRFDKLAVYFAEVPKKGTGILPRELAQAEVSALETQRAMAVRAVRDNSPAYEANVLPGDLITEVNGKPADPANWQSAVRTDPVLHIKLMRNGQARELSVPVPTDWRPE